MRASINIVKKQQNTNIFIKEIVFLSEIYAFCTKNNGFYLKKKTILAFQIPALEIHKKGVAASINRCGHLLIDAAIY